MNIASVEFPLTLYYDASCSLCAKEISILKTYDSEDRLRLVDCSSSSFHDAYAAADNVTQQAMMKAIHARDTAGRWFRGIDVFELAYRAVGIDVMARLWANPRLRPLWNRIYPWIARNRMALSRLGLTAAFGWMIRYMAWRAQRRARICRDGACGCALARPMAPNAADE